jgi:hypothetical protein
MADTISIVDRDRVIDALHRWVYGIDRSDEELLRSTIFEDIFVDASLYRNKGLNIPDISGKDDVIQRLLELRRQCGTMHYLSNFRASINNNIGHANCYVYAQHFRHGLGIHFETSDIFTMAHIYDVVLSRNEDGWQIKELKMIPMWMTGNLHICGFPDILSKQL